MKLIGYMAVHNGAEFIEYAIRSTAPYCDRFIVVEGAWGENIMANGKPRSADGTIEIVQKLMEEFPQIELVMTNSRNQLEQRSQIFNILDSECSEYWLWLIDHDEVYDWRNIETMKSELKTTFAECLKINSYTFINDFWHYVEIAWPRLYRIYCFNQYEFYAPNNLLKNNQVLPVQTIEDKVVYYHYSYCHSPERFMEKRKERMLLHGQFKWNLDENGRVIAPGTCIREFKGTHPEIMRTHPLYTEPNV